MEKQSGDKSVTTDDEIIKEYGSKDGDIFDTIIGYIEEIIIDPEFIELKEEFLDTHYEKFEACEENKHEYMDIHMQYTDLIEKHIEAALCKRMPHFSMEPFLKQIVRKHDQNDLDGEIFDILVGLTDFLTFKDMILDHKAILLLRVQGTQEKKYFVFFAAVIVTYRHDILPIYSI